MKSRKRSGPFAVALLSWVLALPGFAALPAAGADPELAQLKSYWHDQRIDYFETATAAGQNAALNAFGYTFTRTECQVFAGQQPDTVPLELYWSEARQDNATLASPESVREVLVAGYEKKATEGYVYSAPHPGTVALKLFFSQRLTDYYTTTAASGEQDALRKGYSFVRIEGYVFPAKQEAAALPAGSAGRGMPQVGDLTTEHQRNPLGIDSAAPRLGWIVRAGYNGARQSAYEVAVSSRPGHVGDVWSTGRVASADSFDVIYAGPSLAAHTRYWWSVRVWDGERASAWSEPAWFETAFPDASAFAGQWIGREATRTASEQPEVLLRREFALAAKPISTARLYVAGLGYYKAWINGQRVGDHELDPAYTVYDRRVLYATYDVTALLRVGKPNVIGSSLGRGFFADYGDVDTEVAPWLAEPRLKLELDITYADGSSAQVLSDGSWQAGKGPTLLNSVKYGESYDARLEQPGWNSPGFAASGWTPALVVAAPAGALHAQNVEPIKVTGELPKPVLTRQQGGALLYDFRTTRAGWATVSLRGAAGAAVTIEYGEKLNADGSVNTGGGGPNGSRGVQTYHYTLRGAGGGESYTPSYSYNGYRFVRIVPQGSVTVTGVTGKLLNTAIATTGSFSSSSALLNRYHAAMVAALRSNMYGIPTDTPMYEKRGWTADAHLVADSALRNFASQNFWEKWMLDHRDNQAADGGIAQIVPNENPGGAQSDPFVGSTADPIWSASYVLINHALYRQRGDLRTIEQNYAGMRAWMRKWMQTLAASGHVFTGTTWGDHEPAWGSGTNNAIVGTAFVYDAALKLAEMARAIGPADDAREYEAFAGQVRTALNARYLDAATHVYDYPYTASMPGGGPPGGAAGAAPPAGVAAPAMQAPQLSAAEIDARQFQTDNVLPLAFGLVPEPQRAALCARLLQDVKARQDHITTGATVLKSVLPAITDCGDAELAYRAAVNPTFPGWGYWFLALDGSRGAGGETLIVDTHWEAWGEGARSHDHAFRGTIDDWLYGYIAGLQPEQPAWRRIRVKPYPLEALTHAEAAVISPLGRVASAWRRDGAQLELDVEVPVGATAEVYVPLAAGATVRQSGGAQAREVAGGYARFEVESGHYRFVSHP